MLFVRSFPGHALHEKGLQRQTSFGPLVSSQERRALAVTLIICSSTARQPVIVGSPWGFTYEFLCSCLRRDVQDGCLRCPGGQAGRMSPANRPAAEPSRPAPLVLLRPALPRPPRRCAPPRPARPWYVGVVDSNALRLHD